jgi:hypothetical protein
MVVPGVTGVAGREIGKVEEAAVAAGWHHGDVDHPRRHVEPDQTWRRSHQGTEITRLGDNRQTRFTDLPPV